MTLFLTIYGACFLGCSLSAMVVKFVLHKRTTIGNLAGLALVQSVIALINEPSLSFEYITVLIAVVALAVTMYEGIKHYVTQ